MRRGVATGAFAFQRLFPEFEAVWLALRQQAPFRAHAPGARRRQPAEQFGFVNTPIYRGSTVLYPTYEE